MKFDSSLGQKYIIILSTKQNQLTSCTAFYSTKCDYHWYLYGAIFFYYNLQRTSFIHSVENWVELDSNGCRKYCSRYKVTCMAVALPKIYHYVPSSSLILAVASGWKMTTPLSVVVSCAVNSSSPSYTSSLLIGTCTVWRESPGAKVTTCVTAV